MSATARRAPHKSLFWSLIASAPSDALGLAPGSAAPRAPFDHDHSRRNRARRQAADFDIRVAAVDSRCVRRPFCAWWDRPPLRALNYPPRLAHRHCGDDDSFGSARRSSIVAPSRTGRSPVVRAERFGGDAGAWRILSAFQNSSRTAVAARPLNRPQTRLIRRPFHRMLARRSAFRGPACTRGRRRAGTACHYQLVKCRRLARVEVCSRVRLAVFAGINVPFPTRRAVVELLDEVKAGGR